MPDDLLDMPWDFCPECQHAPCVAGGPAYCTLSPRMIAAQRIEDELLDLGTAHPGRLFEAFFIIDYTGPRACDCQCWQQENADGPWCGYCGHHTTDHNGLNGLDGCDPGGSADA